MTYTFLVCVFQLRKFWYPIKLSRAKILGNAELFIKSGSDINLTCVALQSPAPPSFIYWYKGGRVVNYSQRGGISVLTERQTKTSKLVIARAMPSDSGNYTCSPSSSVIRTVCECCGTRCAPVGREEKYFVYAGRGLSTFAFGTAFCRMPIAIKFWSKIFSTLEEAQQKLANVYKSMELPDRNISEGLRENTTDGESEQLKNEAFQCFSTNIKIEELKIF
ncbi:defective proboscis extension response [Culex quinquefasciatus]|uniref:Defective proboscis extension response n=1 Tax=Culex quinquefasciatus TaxID=7176 RepID=B0X5N6_CULQU|nr:defective proboscis extension response [Culex quinquefasciatus]|eukprot:XP_001864958.1 defective proboscis extension response [Culex quinquefasciatus]